MYNNIPFCFFIFLYKRRRRLLSSKHIHITTSPIANLGTLRQSMSYFSSCLVDLHESISITLSDLALFILKLITGSSEVHMQGIKIKIHYTKTWKPYRLLFNVIFDILSAICMFPMHRWRCLNTQCPSKVNLFRFFFKFCLITLTTLSPVNELQLVSHVTTSAHFLKAMQDWWRRQWGLQWDIVFTYLYNFLITRL